VARKKKKKLNKTVSGIKSALRDGKKIIPGPESTAGDYNKADPPEDADPRLKKMVLVCKRRQDVRQSGCWRECKAGCKSLLHTRNHIPMPTPHPFPQAPIVII
jgi:hypothetical protein